MSQPRATKRPRQDIQSGVRPADDQPNRPPKTPTGTTIPDQTPDSTPISYKVSGTEPHDHVQKDTRAQERNIRLGKETRGNWVGGMDPSVFLGRFLPPVGNNIARPAFNATALGDVAKITKELLMYGPFVSTEPFLFALLTLTIGVSRSTLWPPTHHT